ncbi:MAG: ABC transporter ATP-binding protein [Thermoleophilaceae bacterium]
MSDIELNGVSKVYLGKTRAVDDVTLTIGSGEFMVLVGPSGCGKTTLMRMVAGLEEVTEGSISIGGEDVTAVPPRRRDVAMVFQDYALYPHMTVRKNLGYGLKVRKAPREEIDRRVDKVTRMLGLVELLDRRPAALSGGQRQRVAMGRAIVREPAAFLMDEPLSNLDAKLRVGMRAELARLHERIGVTTIYVTHDQVEAMTLGQRVAVLRAGRLEQVGRPHALYRQPANLFVAAFLGSPAMNLVEATVGAGTVEFADFRIPIGDGWAPARDGRRVIVGIRPEDLEDAEFSDPELPRIEVTAAVHEDVGADTHVIFPVDAPRIEAAALGDAIDDRNEAALLAEDETTLFNARLDRRTRARAGARLTLTVDPAALYFFDPATHDALPSPTHATGRG